MFRFPFSLRKIGVLSCVVTIALLAVVTVPANGTAQQNAARVQVEAEGTGTTKMEALHAAWMDAVRNAVGMYMVDNTRLEDDKLTEQVVTHSRGQVNSYEVLSETQQNNVWNIKIRANIDKDILQETAKAAQSHTATFDGTSLAASQATRKTKKQTQIEALKALKSLFDFDDVFMYSFKVSVMNSRGKETAVGLHTVKLDKRVYVEKIKNIIKALDKICTSSRDHAIYPESHVEGNVKFWKSLDVLEKIIGGRASSYFHYGAPTFNENEFAIAYSTSAMKVYKFEDKEVFDALKNLFPKRIIVFSTETGDSFTPTEIKLFFQPCFVIDKGCIFIIPSLMFGSSAFAQLTPESGRGKFIFSSPLELTQDELVNTKQITGRYYIKNVNR